MAGAVASQTAAQTQRNIGKRQPPAARSAGGSSSELAPAESGAPEPPPECDAPLLDLKPRAHSAGRQEASFTQGLGKTHAAAALTSRSCSSDPAPAKLMVPGPFPELEAQILVAKARA